MTIKQIAEKGQQVVLNSDQSPPIGAVLEQPSTPTLEEFTGSAESDSVVQFERTTAEQIVIRKKFFFEKIIISEILHIEFQLIVKHCIFIVF